MKSTLENNLSFLKRENVIFADCLQAVRMENLLHEISPERTVEVYRLLGEMGFGREIVGVFRKKGK